MRHQVASSSSVVVRAALPALLPPLLLLLLLGLPASPAVASGDGGGLHVHDSAHMFSHMEHLSIKQPDHNMTEAEQEYYYFKMHDFDNNNRLDGLEVLKSLVDHDAKDSAPLSDQLLEQAVNEVLKDEDANGDGYIDYAEFVASQRKADEDVRK